MSHMVLKKGMKQTALIIHIQKMYKVCGMTSDQKELIVRDGKGVCIHIKRGDIVNVLQRTELYRS